MERPYRVPQPESGYVVDIIDTTEAISIPCSTVVHANREAAWACAEVGEQAASPFPIVSVTIYSAALVRATCDSRRKAALAEPEDAT